MGKTTKRLSGEKSANAARFGAELARLRGRRGLSQQEAADAVGITNGQQIGRYERGERLPDPELLISIARTFRMSLDTVLLGQERELRTDGSGNAPSGRVEGDANVPAPIREAQGRVEFIFHTFGEGSVQWSALVKFLEAIAPIAPVPRTVVTASRPGGRARRGSAQN